MPDRATFDHFAQGLRGQVLQPADAGYDAARAIYNAMIDKRPGMIVRCVDVADVIAALGFAREHGLETAVRGGGHSGPGLGLVDDGLVIDLSAMKGIRVDPEAHTVRVEPGCRWADVDHATHAFGLATVGGVIASTGVAGLTLGGGHGYLSRKYGLTVDNLISADVVLADGRLVHASATENPDLYWAIRGGGGNFGIVTSFEFRLHPVDTVIAGPMFWGLDQLEPTMRWYREWLPTAPRDVNAVYIIGAVPPSPPFPEEVQGRNVCGLVWCCTGLEEEAQEALRSARDAAPPTFEHVGPMPYPMLQGLFDTFYPEGLQWYWKGDFFRELSDAAIAEHRRFAEVPTGLSLMHLYPIDGAVRSVDARDSAWAHRDATWSMVIAGVDGDPANRQLISDWARDYWQALNPHSTGAAYVNFMMEEGQDRIRSTYGENYGRLSGIKARYDPANFFHVNQNIRPAA